MELVVEKDRYILGVMYFNRDREIGCQGLETESDFQVFRGRYWMIYVKIQRENECQVFLEREWGF